MLKYRPVDKTILMIRKKRYRSISLIASSSDRHRDYVNVVLDSSVAGLDICLLLYWYCQISIQTMKIHYQIQSSTRTILGCLTKDVTCSGMPNARSHQRNSGGKERHFCFSTCAWTEKEGSALKQNRHYRKQSNIEMILFFFLGTEFINSDNALTAGQKSKIKI